MPHTLPVKTSDIPAVNSTSKAARGVGVFQDINVIVYCCYKINMNFFLHVDRGDCNEMSVFPSPS